MEVEMSMIEGMNIVDNALNLALADLEGRGLPKDEAQIALLIRLQSIVPDEVSSIAEILRDDPEVLAAVNKTTKDELPASNSA
jgi:hypothetical protein